MCMAIKLIIFSEEGMIELIIAFKYAKPLARSLNEQIWLFMNSIIENLF